MEVQQQFGDQVQFIGLPSLSDDFDAMNAFVNQAGATNFPNLPDLNGEVWGNFGVVQQSSYVFINDDGTWRVSGYGSLPSDVAELIAN